MRYKRTGAASIGQGDVLAISATSESRTLQRCGAPRRSYGAVIMSTRAASQASLGMTATRMLETGRMHGVKTRRIGAAITRRRAALAGRDKAVAGMSKLALLYTTMAGEAPFRMAGEAPMLGEEVTEALLAVALVVQAGTTATQPSTTGRRLGQNQRKPGVAITSTRAALAPRRVARTLTAMPHWPTGSRPGRLRRKLGAARTSTRAVQRGRVLRSLTATRR